MENKKTLIYFIIIAVLLGITIFNNSFFYKKSDKNINNVSKNKIAEQNNKHDSEGPKKKTIFNANRKNNNSNSSSTKIDDLKNSDDFDINLVDASLREYMHSLYFQYRNSKDRNEFMDKIRSHLLKEFSPETASQLIKVYEAYIDCEIAIQEKMLQFDQPKNSEDMLYIENEIFSFRKRVLGGELAERLFGEEHNSTIFKIMKEDIYKDEFLYGSEKESKLKELASEIYETRSDINLYDKTGESLYQEKLLIYKRDLEEMSEDERKEKIREFRREYLSDEEIGKIEMAEESATLSAEKDKIYNESKNDISNSSYLNENEKEKKIYELQNSIYGDMADEIRKGEAFSEEYNLQLKSKIKDDNFIK